MDLEHEGHVIEEDNTLQSEHVVEGVKDVPIFHTMLPYWSAIEIQTNDLMHLFEGIHDLLLKLWIKRKYNNGKNSIISPFGNEFDLLLCSQKLVNLFNRKIRSIIKHGKYWKASECMVFHLYLSHLLESFLPAHLFQHHMKLVAYTPLDPSTSCCSTTRTTAVLHNIPI